MRIHLMKVIGFAATSAMIAAPAWAQDYPPPPPPAVVAPPSNNVVVTPPAPPAAPQPAAPSAVVVNPQPQQTEVYTNRGTGLIAGGASLLGVTYTATVIGAIVADANNGNCSHGDSAIGCPTAYWPLYIPVAGPFIEMGHWSGTNSTAGKALLGVDGALQTIGAAMIVTGVIEASASRAAGAPPAYTQKPAKKGHFVLSPFASATSAGMGASGTF